MMNQNQQLLPIEKQKLIEKVVKVMEENMDGTSVNVKTGEVVGHEVELLTLPKFVVNAQILGAYLAGLAGSRKIMLIDGPVSFEEKLES
jgi:hypothetical protein